MTQLASMEITGIAAGGDGVGRIDKMVAFVPRTAPGDRAQVSLTVSKKFARGHLEAIERPSPSRVDPPCEHYVVDRCGGCQLQHMDYPAQLVAKEQIIVDSIKRIGHRTVASATVMPSTAQWRYRRKLTLHVRRTREGWIAGLHPYDDAKWVFDLKDCPITDERVLACWGELRAVFDLLPDERAFRMSVRALPTGCSVVVEGGSSWRGAEEMFNGASSVQELWWKPDEGRVRRMFSREDAPTDGAAFVQVNAAVADELRTHVLARVRAHRPRTVVDAYAGSGEMALALADSRTTVIAIELDAAAVKTFRDKLTNPSRAIAGLVEEHLPGLLPADVVILNPPRAGLDSRVTRALQDATSAPRAIIYVSCDPATLARDLARMPRYRLASVQAYDMFPQTAHVETVCELVPEAA